ncbi:MAG: lysylphosphatidylglycerol synthase transmembrane domain-containing protein [Bacteroidales bacterium]|nr:lysylphosphatidylglycerol synthase transmembrane domain-containing protein [Bacteroidales bacterium]
MKIKLNNIIKIAVTLAILSFLLWKVEFNAAGFEKTLSSVRLGYFLLSLFGVILVLGIKSYRWRLLIRNEGATYSAYKGFAAYMASDAVGIVTPGRIGEIARLYYLREESPISFYSAFKTIVSDRIFDFTMLGWFGLSGMLYYFKTFGDHPGLYYALGVLALFILGYYVTIKFLEIILKIPRLQRLPVIRFIYESFLAVLGKHMLRMWAITILAYLMYFGFSWLIMLSLHLSPSYIDVAFIMSIMSLSTIIPLSVAGFGTREATLVLLFSYYGLASETAISFSLMHFTAFFLWGGLIGLVFWLLMPISLQQVKDDSKSIFLLFKPDAEQEQE